MQDSKQLTKMNEEQQRVSSILLDSLALLCKNSLTFKTELTVQGLIGITVDRDNVFLVQIDQRFLPDETQEIKQEPYYEAECANGSDSAQKPVKRRKKRGLKQVKFLSADETQTECGFNQDVKIEEPYEDDGSGYDDYGFTGDTENQSTFADVAPVPAARKMQAMCGKIGRSAAIANAGATESYDLVEGGDIDPQDVVAEPGDDISWASEEDVMQFSSGRNQQKFVRGGTMRKSLPSSRGRTSKGATRGRQLCTNQGMAPSGIRRLKVSSSDPYVINETSHLCGYPNCGKRFRFRHDLLRHQTKKHGRQPVSRGRGTRPCHGFEDCD